MIVRQWERARTACGAFWKRNTTRLSAGETLAYWIYMPTTGWINIFLVERYFFPYPILQQVGLHTVYLLLKIFGAPFVGWMKRRLRASYDIGPETMCKRGAMLDTVVLTCWHLGLYTALALIFRVPGLTIAVAVAVQLAENLGLGWWYSLLCKWCTALCRAYPKLELIVLKRAASE